MQVPSSTPGVGMNATRSIPLLTPASREWDLPARPLTAARLVVICCVALSSAATARAQDRMQPSPAAQPQVVPKKEGEYGGVIPGKGTTKKRKGKNALSWVGFQPKDDGAVRIFVQLSNEVPFDQAVRNGVLYIKLQGAKYRNRNARRRLDTRFSDTSISRVTTRYVRKRRARKGRPAQSAGVEIRIQFKKPDDAREARTELVAEKDGYTYLFLDFDGSGGGTIDDSKDSDDGQ